MPSVQHHFAQGIAGHELSLINRWRQQRLDLRRHLLQSMCSQLSSATQNEQEAQLEGLRGQLLDYISIGHFEVYSGLMRKQSASNPELRMLIAYLFRCIGSSTDLVLEFNAGCERAHIFVRSNQMNEALGKLTRSLIVRFALEEQLLELTTDHNSWAQAPRL